VRDKLAMHRDHLDVTV